MSTFDVPLDAPRPVRLDYGPMSVHRPRWKPWRDANYGDWLACLAPRFSNATTAPFVCIVNDDYAPEGFILEVVAEDGKRTKIMEGDFNLLNAAFFRIIRNNRNAYRRRLRKLEAAKKAAIDSDLARDITRYVSQAIVPQIISAAPPMSAAPPGSTYESEVRKRYASMVADLAVSIAREVAVRLVDS